MTTAVTVVLEKGHLHPGMSVFLVKGDARMGGEDGQPLRFKVLRGGHDMRLRLYPPGSIQLPWTRFSGQAAIANGFHDLASFRPGVSFIPVEIFTPEEAPTNTEYLLAVEDRFLRYQDGKEYPKFFQEDHEGEVIHILKGSEGGFKVTRCFSQFCPEARFFRRLGQEFQLPSGAQLVPISEQGRPGKVQQIWDF